MLPDFNPGGVLPVGIHRIDLEAFRKRFAVFDQSDRRLRLFERFQQLVDEAKSSTIVRRIVVGGSFVTAKPEPNDFDCILVLDPAIVGASLRPFEYNLVSRRMAGRVFGGDVLSALDGTAALDQYLAFFQKNRDGAEMGVVEIAL